MNHARSAVVVDMSNLRAMNCIFEQNYGGAGGAIGSIAFEGSASLEVVNCTFLNNEADYGGAIACNHDGLLVEGCTFVGNTAYRGGALELSREAGGLIRGSVFYDNSATIGAVVDCTHLVSPRIEQSIIAFNRDASWIECGVFAEPEFACNDVFGNGEGDAPDCYSDYVGINGNISEDPLFCNAPAGDLRLRESSPCAPSDSCGWMGPYRIGCSTPAER
jgi:predicted outer membrane repeat protein